MFTIIINNLVIASFYNKYDAINYRTYIETYHSNNDSNNENTENNENIENTENNENIEITSVIEPN